MPQLPTLHLSRIKEKPWTQLHMWGKPAAQRNVILSFPWRQNVAPRWTVSGTRRRSHRTSSGAKCWSTSRIGPVMFPRHSLQMMIRHLLKLTVIYCNEFFCLWTSGDNQTSLFSYVESEPSSFHSQSLREKRGAGTVTSGCVKIQLQFCKCWMWDSLLLLNWSHTST